MTKGMDDFGPLAWGPLGYLPPYVFLHGMDKHGEQIVATWLKGRATNVTIDEPFWADYMMKHQGMKDQCLGQLLPVMKEIAGKRKFGRFPVNLRFHAEFPENDGFSGYALLHGSKKNVGDFSISGNGELTDAINPKEGDFDIELELQYQFNDIVNPNGTYVVDTVRSVLAKILTLGRAKDYQLAIIWRADLLIEVRQGRYTWYGYPSPNSIPVRVQGLPRADIDWVGDKKKRAAATERRIIEQLKRNVAANDIKSLADRKQRLLWLFYGISDYMKGTFLERLKFDSNSDEMARLMKQRISPQLRAECIEALKGKRPGGHEPIWPPAP